jgi:hypothetical protein
MLESFAYSPTLYARNSELKALQQLPGDVKDLMFPLIVARPWPNANHLSTLWEKIQSSIGGRNFALDLDVSRYKYDSNKPAQSEFDLLFDDSDGFSNYYELCQSISKSIPVLRTKVINKSQLVFQKKHIDSIGRGVFVNINYDDNIKDLDFFISTISNVFKEDICYVINLGWSRDLISREIWASNIIRLIEMYNPVSGVASNLISDFPFDIVITGSSFPDIFSKYGNESIIEMKERVIFDNLSKKHNRIPIIYGDWGSTRPPVEPKPMKNRPRIDFPIDSNWITYRGEKTVTKFENYRDIANRLVASQNWSKVPQIWGAYMIKWTAEGQDGAIRSPATAAAVRINIHLYRQACLNNNNAIIDGDEPYIDE